VVSVPMGLRLQVSFWIAALVLLVGTLWLLSEVLLPFIAGVGLAYLFSPLARRLERAGMSRMVAALLIIIAFVLCFIFLILLIAPMLGGQLTAFVENVPEYVRRVPGCA
jgi:predicted PurR-regulated permease PerM